MPTQSKALSFHSRKQYLVADFINLLKSLSFCLLLALDKFLTGVSQVCSLPWSLHNYLGMDA